MTIAKWTETPYALTPEVEATARIALEGNIIPIEWYSKILFDNKKPDLNAIIILSDILYWYKPSPIRDEFTGQIIGYKRKFKADLLQRSYDAFSEQFGLSKRQATEAIIRLEKAGFIKRVFRTVKAGGQAHANVLFIKLFPKKVEAITLMRKRFQKGSPIQTGYPPHLNGTPLPSKRETYTKTTHQITPSSSSLEKGDENLKEMITIWDQIVRENKNTTQMTLNRSKKLTQTMKTHFEGDLDQWKQYCQSIASSKFLMGETKENFKATLDWALKEDTILRVQDGSFSLGDRINTSPTQKEQGKAPTSFKTEAEARDYFLQRIRKGLEGDERQRVLEKYGWEKGGFEKLFRIYIESL